MAMVTKTEIFEKIREYNETNERKCPAKELVKMFGKLTIIERKGLESLIKTLKDNGELLSKKGRGGGLYLADGVTNTKVVEAEIVEEDSTDTVIEASPVEVDSEIGNDPPKPDQSDESYNKLMDMVSGNIETDEQWIKTNWPDAWTEEENSVSEDDIDELESESAPF
jgi:DNA-binding IscR family transcriptional regulator